MSKRNWLITGISSGFGLEITKQVLARGDSVYGTVRNTRSIEPLMAEYSEALHVGIVDVTDVPGIHRVVEDAFDRLKAVDVVVSNAGYGLYGAAEEISDSEADHMIDTNLRGSIAFIHATLPYLREQRHGRIIQVASVAGQVGYLGNALYNATKFGVTGYCEALALEMDKFNVGVTVVEPGGARTEYRSRGAKVAENIMAEYEHAHGFMEMLGALAPGDPVKMAARMIESVDMTPAPRHLALGSKAYDQIIEELEGRLKLYKSLEYISRSTDCE